MAERRMFAKRIIDSDMFVEMPVTSRLLYYDLAMRADDDGFVDAPKKIMRMIGASDDDLRLLISKQFLIPFETGIVVIRHWKIHNYIRTDRYRPTPFNDELSKLAEGQCKEYVLKSEKNEDGIPTVYQRYTQDRLGKDRLGKKEKEIYKEREKKTVDEAAASPPQKYGEYKNVILSDEDLEKLKSEFPDWEQRIERLSEYIASSGKKYKSHLATIRSWAKKDSEKPGGKKSEINASESERLSAEIIARELDEANYTKEFIDSVDEAMNAMENRELYEKDEVAGAYDLWNSLTEEQKIWFEER